VVLDRVTDPFFPFLGDINLARLSRMALHHIERNVEFTARTTAMGFTAGPTSNREGTPQQRLGMNELSQGGTMPTFGAG
jgi:hypothetical protein